MMPEGTLDHLIGMASRLAPAGFALGLHVGYAAPRILLRTYPRAWIQVYAVEALVIADPTIHWGLTHDGARRWSALPPLDGRVLSRAADHGLRFGVVCAVTQGGTRSLGSFARGDREPTDAEVDQALHVLTDLHHAVTGLDPLSATEVACLNRWSVETTITRQTFTRH